jgi:hypothetical protein
VAGGDLHVVQIHPGATEVELILTALAAAITETANAIQDAYIELQNAVQERLPRRSPRSMRRPNKVLRYSHQSLYLRKRPSLRCVASAHQVAVRR